MKWGCFEKRSARPDRRVCCELLVAVSVLLLVAGCGHGVIVSNLVEFDGQTPPDRPVVWRNGKLATDYAIRPQDLMEFSVPAGETLTISDSSGLNITANAGVATTSAWIGDFSAYLEISASGFSPAKLCLNRTPGLSFRLNQSERSDR